MVFRDSNSKIKYAFIAFLVIHLFVWSLLPFIRDLLPTDALECVYWGGLFDFGTHKHPPLSGWLAFFFYNLFGKTDFSMYFLGQIFVLGGFIYLFKLGKCFLSETQAALSVMILEGCYAYSYMSIFDGFNPNFILFLIFPAMAYYFYKSINENRLVDWVFLGIFTGFGFLAKYQTLLLLIPMVLYSLIFKNVRKIYKSRGVYVAIIIAFLMFLPHLIWLFNHDFFSFLYFKECEDRYSHVYFGVIKYLEAPFLFLLDQVCAIAGTVFIFVVTRFRFKIPFNFNAETDTLDRYFLIFLGLFPVLLQAFPGLFTGNKIVGTWGYPMVYMVGIMLFYFFPLKPDEKIFKYVTTWVYTAMAIVLTVMVMLFSIEKNYRSRYPYKIISNDMKTIFKANTGKELNYVGGYIEFALPLSVYSDFQPKMILDTYGEPNPWVSQNNIKKCGAIIMVRSLELLPEQIKKLVPYSNLKISEPKEYLFKIYNKFGRERDYIIHYVIVYPKK